MWFVRLELHLALAVVSNIVETDIYERNPKTDYPTRKANEYLQGQTNVREHNLSQWYRWCC